MEYLGDEFDLDDQDFGTVEQAAAYAGEDVIEIPSEEPVETHDKPEDGNEVESEDGLETYLPEQGVTVTGKASLPFTINKRLTRFEIATLVSRRARELNEGAEPLYPPIPAQRGPRYALLVSHEEIMRKLPPYVVIRTLPGGGQIEIPLQEAIIPEFYRTSIGVNYLE